MPMLTRELLKDLGIGLSDQEYKLLADHFETTLQDRVIKEIVEELNPEQAWQLSQLQSASDDQLYGWLLANVPDFRDIVSDEVDILLGEIAENSESF
ncbi:MAG TPA: hypothetical protein VFN51_01975 [Candidatus Saccharimonadales bacterium]|nr:hypothetical protein [Candidatus Saccharimonadales bacterium]